MLAVVFVTAFFFILFSTKISPITKIGFKKVGYFWLGAAVISLMAIGAKLQGQMASVELAALNFKIEASYSQLDRDLRGHQQRYCNQVFVKTDMSPSNFQEVQDRYTRACETFSKWLPKLAEDKSYTAFFRALQDTQFSHDTVLAQDLEHIQYYVNDLAKDIAQVVVLKDQTGLSENYQAFALIVAIFFGPVALGLRLGKVWVEIRLERGDSTPS